MAVVTVAALLAPPLLAQDRRAGRSVRQTYGARLTPVGPNDAPQNSARVVRRLETRVNGRLSTRIERYTPPGQNPTAALATSPTDATATLRRQVDPVPQADEGDPPRR